jgi:hypothetical protein
MSIFAAADQITMTLRPSCDPIHVQLDEAVAMRLLADGVPLALLIDLALPLGHVAQLWWETERAGQR